MTYNEAALGYAQSASWSDQFVINPEFDTMYEGSRAAYPVNQEFSMFSIPEHLLPDFSELEYYSLQDMYDMDFLDPMMDWRSLKTSEKKAVAEAFWLDLLDPTDEEYA